VLVAQLQQGRAAADELCGKLGQVSPVRSLGIDQGIEPKIGAHRPSPITLLIFLDYLFRSRAPCKPVPDARSATGAARAHAPCHVGEFLLDCGLAVTREARVVPFFVQIKCHLGKSYEVANKLADSEIASEIYSTAGDFDLLVKFYVEAGTDIGHFVNEKVQTIAGIQDTRTIITFKAF
jgi:DNA-binding Lrp family transcriptional regulator